MQVREITTLILNISEKIEQEKQFLTQLDNVIGDGDHGINLSRGFQAVKLKIENNEYPTPSDLLKTVGMTLVSTVGGASGPLYGTAFMNMAKSFTQKQDIGISDFADALSFAVEGIQMRGKSKPGEKTMLDAMVPALVAMQNAIITKQSVGNILELATVAAWDGVEYTKSIAATKGRASYLGERSIGHQDPGATSFSFMLEQVKKAVE